MEEGSLRLLRWVLLATTVVIMALTVALLVSTEAVMDGGVSTTTLVESEGLRVSVAQRIVYNTELLKSCAVGSAGCADSRAVVAELNADVNTFASLIVLLGVTHPPTSQEQVSVPPLTPPYAPSHRPVAHAARTVLLHRFRHGVTVQWRADGREPVVCGHAVTVHGCG